MTARSFDGDQLSATAEILDLEERRRNALLAGDLPTLRELVSPRCVYVHGRGNLDTGSGYLTALDSGDVTVVALDICEQRIVVADDTAVVSFRQDATVRLRDGEHSSTSRVTAVWNLAQSTPRLVVHHSTLLEKE